MTDRPQALDDLRAQARSPELADRVALAGQQDIPKELLFFLAADIAPQVRQKIAENGKTPLAADLILARDSEEEVRARLVDKSVARIPANDEVEPEPIPGLLEQVLALLADDKSEAIRKSLSLAIADLKHAPHSAVSRLARDANVDIAGPVLKNSPVLEQDDLAATVERAASDDHLDAVASRPSLPASVSHALVKLGRDSSVRTLLKNPSTHLRESTLDLVLDQAPDHPSWHEPLSVHPDLPSGAAARLACYISQALIVSLDEAEADRCTLAPRIAEKARSLIEQGETADDACAYSEPVLRAMIDRGDNDRLAAGLAQRANLNYGTVCEILAAAAPRAVVALAWAAKLSMEFAVTLQSQVARIPPGAMLTARQDGGYPMSELELADQLRFFGAKQTAAE